MNKYTYICILKMSMQKYILKVICWWDCSENSVEATIIRCDNTLLEVNQKVGCCGSPFVERTPDPAKWVKAGEAALAKACTLFINNGKKQNKTKTLLWQGQNLGEKNSPAQEKKVHCIISLRKYKVDFTVLWAMSIFLSLFF